MVSTVILAVFAALAAGAYGGGTLHGMTAALTAYRFLVGIGIGGEYPAGSVACSEATGELKAGTRNRWFILFTNGKYFDNRTFMSSEQELTRFHSCH